MLCHNFYKIRKNLKNNHQLPLWFQGPWWLFASRISCKYLLFFFFMFVWRCPFGFFESEKRGRGKWLSAPQPLCEYCTMKKVTKDKKQEIVKERDCEDWCFVCKDGGELILCDFE